jgi:aminopeptidase N
MSSYLNAFFVGELDYITNNDIRQPNETLHRVITRPDQLPKVKYALENSIDALDALEQYADFKYELKKMDSAGVPGKGGGAYN